MSRQGMKAALRQWFLCFFLCSVLGWVYEVFLEVVVYRWGFTNRGVLFGPYCPVYGVGALAFLLCLGRLMERREPRWLLRIRPLLIFLGCMAVATAIELATSYLLQALTGSWPWQTYADYRFHFQARIALSPSIRFGLGGMLFLYGLLPLIRRLSDRLGEAGGKLLCLAAGGAMLLDCLLTLAL